MSACLSVSLAACLFDCLSDCLSVCLPVCLSACLSACLYVCWHALRRPNAHRRVSPNTKCDVVYAFDDDFDRLHIAMAAHMRMHSTFVWQLGQVCSIIDQYTMPYACGESTNVDGCVVDSCSYIIHMPATSARVMCCSNAHLSMMVSTICTLQCWLVCICSR